jgi:hypothetical protein
MHDVLQDMVKQSGLQYITSFKLITLNKKHTRWLKDKGRSRLLSASVHSRLGNLAGMPLSELQAELDGIFIPSTPPFLPLSACLSHSFFVSHFLCHSISSVSSSKYILTLASLLLQSYDLTRARNRALS